VGNGDGSAGVLSDRAHAPRAPLSGGGRALHDRFVTALDDDLDLPSALAVVRETLRADLAADERRWLILDADFVLGLDLGRSGSAAAKEPAELAELLAQRAAARSARDFARADELRDRITELGYAVSDGPEGQTVQRRG
jgi:cysteinyl-tRNA synthetase